MKLALKNRRFWSAALFVNALFLAARADAAVSTFQPRPLQSLPFIFGIAVEPTEPTNLLIATRRGLFRAGPNGIAKRISHSREIFWSVVIDSTTPTRLYAAGTTESGEADAPLVSSDSGRRFTRLIPRDRARRKFRAVFVSNAGSGTLYGLSDDIWRSRDGGVSWNRTGIPPVRTIDITVSSLDAQSLYAATRSGILTSRDSGRTWNKLDGDFCLQPVTAIAAGPDGILYAFSLCKGLVRIDERTGKTTVVRRYFGGCILQHLAIDPRDSNRIYAVERCHRLLSSLDGGLSWQIYGRPNSGLIDCVAEASNKKQNRISRHVNRSKQTKMIDARAAIP